MESIDHLRYPIGLFQAPTIISRSYREDWMGQIESLPQRLTRLVASFSDEDWAECYRPSSWNARQVVHHLPDSHLNAYIRFKWTLTEEQPIIKPYFEERWAELPDYHEEDPEVSLLMLQVLHKRWLGVLNRISESGWKKAFVHPEHEKPLKLDYMLGLYAWHGEHHLAHLQLIASKR